VRSEARICLVFFLFFSSNEALQHEPEQSIRTRLINQSPLPFCSICQKKKTKVHVSLEENGVHLAVERRGADVDSGGREDEVVSAPNRPPHTECKSLPDASIIVLYQAGYNARATDSAGSVATASGLVLPAVLIWRYHPYGAVAVELSLKCRCSIIF
jgi:hypothetical protein